MPHCINALCVTDEYIFVGLDDNSIHQYPRLNTQNPTPRQFKGHLGPVTCLCFHEKHGLFSGSTDASIRQCRADNGKFIAEFNGNMIFFIQMEKIVDFLFLMIL